MDFTKEPQRVLSMCTGIQGIERGLARAGVTIQPVVYLEIEAWVCANLVAGMEASILAPAPIFTDITKFDASPFRGKVHGIVGGYPCPGESTAGLRQGHLYKGFIWPNIRRAIADSRPLWCFFENVDDHLTGTYPIVQRSLRNMGYAVEAGIYTADEVGAPHERKRLFILAVSDELGNSPCFNKWYEWIRQERLQKQNRRSSSQKLAYADCTGQPIVGDNGITHEQDDPGISYPGAAEQLGDTESLGIQGQRSQGQQVSGVPVREDVSGCPGGRDRWPAGQGQQQYGWEAPRTTEPGLGITINGYNFREDLLRAAGNSVVEQCAEIAFIELMGKHLSSHGFKK